MHVRGHERHDDLPLQRRELASDQVGEVAQLRLVEVEPLLKGEGVVVHLVDVVLGRRAPGDLRDRRDHLPEVGQDPRLPLRVRIVI